MTWRQKVRRVGIPVLVLISLAIIIIGVAAYLTLEHRAEFEVSSLTLSKTSAIIGEEVTVYVEVRNVGSVSGTYRAALVINGEKVQEKEVRLEPGEARTVTFVVVENANGTYIIEVGKLTRSLRVLAPAAFRLSNLAISPSEPEVGQPILISVNVKNVGEVEGTCTLKLKINEATEGTRDVTLAGGAAETVSFRVTIPISGNYVIDVNGLKSSLKVLKPLPGPFSVVEPEPECISITTTPYFAWQSSKNAEKYILEIATSPQFGDTVVYRKELGPDTREHRVDTPLKSLKKYYYRVTAVNERGGTTASNTPGWFTTCLHLPDTVTSLAVSPDGAKAVVTYLSEKTVTVISLMDPPRIIANLTLPKAAKDVAVTYDGKYAVIAGPPGYVLSLDTLTLREIVYDIPVKSWGIVASKVVTAPNSNVAYLVNDLLGANPIVSVLDVASARVTDYIRVYEITSLMTTPVDPYDII
uniref:Fibronectin type-III domain-containing protein n=1 Tax=Thermofilum pendens TaxID=2269 RepID=A0A7C1P0P2_THEPE